MMPFGFFRRKQESGARHAPDAIDLLQAHIDALWQRTSRSPLARIERSPRGDGSLYVEHRDDTYEIACEERGVEYWRERNLSPDDAAFILIFAQASFIYGKEEAEVRRSGHGTLGYSRWNWMYPTIQTMAGISEDFGDRVHSNYRQVLQRAPLGKDEIASNRFPIPPDCLPETD
ncbi:hypothetical protein N7E02_18235 [Aliirhizobium terrae]|uniref:hypothetical protein n=1 Tax=Terrirhizobium terrae TaxID=2926709 RepID=UPI0025763869|nr:hypothetical protein [Rhizobium sp. CC-CFT758]WJH42111.1 hypothetical protein N7E02_18235 [Rhizobium sp. CC-CFT758]